MIILRYSSSTKSVKLETGDIIFISNFTLISNYLVQSVAISRWNSSALPYSRYIFRVKSLKTDCL